MVTIEHIDIFSCPHGSSEAMCVTTNGMIKNNGRAVMGRGLALSVENRYHVAAKLAEHIRMCGNTPCDLGIYDGFHVLSFPTKNDWRNASDLQLIKESSAKLVQLADDLNLTKIYTVRPGCGLGNLNWETQVRPAIEPILDNRFIVIL